MSNTNFSVGKFDPPKSNTPKHNPLLRTAVGGFPFEDDQSPILVPVSLNDNALKEEKENLTPIDNISAQRSGSTSPQQLPVTSEVSVSLQTEQPQSYSSKFGSYFSSVPSAFTSFTNTLTGQSIPSLTSGLDPPQPQKTIEPLSTPVSFSENTTPPTFVSVSPSALPLSNLPPPSSVSFSTSLSAPPQSQGSNDSFSSVPLISPPTETPSFISSSSNSPQFYIPPPTPIDALLTPKTATDFSPNAPPPHPPLTRTTPISSPPLACAETSSSTPKPDSVGSYRLKGLKKPVYALPPGLGTTPVNHTVMAPPVLPSSEGAEYCTVDSSVSSSSAPPCDTSASNPPEAAETYREVYHHWFLKKIVETKTLWQPFSMADSMNIEEAFLDPTKSQVVQTDGGRYDVHLTERQRKSVYWEEKPTEVRRCSWFYKASLESRYIPYDEKVCDLLENEFKTATLTGSWNKTISLENEEQVVMYSPKVIVHHVKPDMSLANFAWDSSAEQSVKPRMVSRGLDNFDITEGEPEKIDHLLFLVHGIGSFCDLKFRPIVEVVDDFRSIALQLTASHFKGASDMGTLGRVEMLPVSWHAALHSEESGIDKKLKSVTLPSIPKLRYFTNDTVLDVLFYTSPMYCEKIITAVCKEMNRQYALFLSRNPNYNGCVSVGGHSLGSLILFDLLSNQRPPSEANSEPFADQSEEVETQPDEPPSTSSPKTPLNKGVSYVTIGMAGTGQPYIKYPQLKFKPSMFFAFGSPIGMFVNVRGIDSLGEDFSFPTCSKFFNIFHPFDPVAYRIEPLIAPAMENIRPVLIPHHKGRKRMHLELKDTLEYVGTALKQKIYDSMKNTWNKVSSLTTLNKTEATVQQEVTKVIEEQLLSDTADVYTEPTQELEPGKLVGKINGGQRVDYVLQEAPLESFNEYIFALSSHVCYWDSEDTMLMVLKEIYSDLGVSADNQVPQQILPFDITQSDGLEHLNGAVDSSSQQSSSSNLYSSESRVRNL